MTNIYIYIYILFLKCFLNSKVVTYTSSNQFLSTIFKDRTKLFCLEWSRLNDYSKKWSQNLELGGVLRLVMCSDFGLGLCYYLVPVWIRRIRFPLLRFSFFFFFFFGTRNWRQMLLFMYCAWTVVEIFDFSTIFSTSVGLVYCSLDSQILLFNNFFNKNGSHGTIHLFKNYFATVFSVFSFQFQQNKFYPNRPLVA